MKVNFSIIILTFNEELNIAKCLDAVKECQDIVVLDSYSTDRTLDIVKAYSNVRVFQRKFDNFANQRNYAIDNLKFVHHWILHLDADEVVNTDFIEECNRFAGSDNKSAYWVPNKLMFFDKWIKYASSYPVYQMRFMKLGEVRYIQVGHGQREGEALRGFGYMKNPYLHYNFSKGISEWIEKHNRYSLAEAIEEINEQPISIWNIFSKEKIIRRRTLKYISHKLCCRPFFRFFFLFVLKKGFLDGMPGYYYCQLMAIYERMIVLKKREIIMNRSNK